jgi:MoaA/NifB/PqqE/SkfB family radical SAM enzyme
MMIRRRETWGTLCYDTSCHRFSCVERAPGGAGPYPGKPVVLNVVVTYDCNLDCPHCVAKDFAGVVDDDLRLSDELVAWINESPFMVVVLTGGEPLLPPHDGTSAELIRAIRGKGIVLDTNGTLQPAPDLAAQLRRRNVLVRVSMDSIRGEDETRLRRPGRASPTMRRQFYRDKLRNIDWFVASGIQTAVQTVVWHKNARPLFQMIDWLRDSRIRQWYLQRLIPSRELRHPHPRLLTEPDGYQRTVAELARRCQGAGIECIAKRDLRHNSVYLLMADGELYTQGAEPGEKVRLGAIHDPFDYFARVSAADHAARSYLANG